MDSWWIFSPFISFNLHWPVETSFFHHRAYQRVLGLPAAEVLMESSPGHQIAAAGEMMGMRSSYWRTEADGCETDELKVS